MQHRMQHTTSVSAKRVPQLWLQAEALNPGPRDLPIAPRGKGRFPSPTEQLRNTHPTPKVKRDRNSGARYKLPANFGKHAISKIRACAGLVRQAARLAKLQPQCECRNVGCLRRAQARAPKQAGGERGAKSQARKQGSPACLGIDLMMPRHHDTDA